MVDVTLGVEACVGIDHGNQVGGVGAGWDMLVRGCQLAAGLSNPTHLYVRGSLRRKPPWVGSQVWCFHCGMLVDVHRCACGVCAR